MHWNLGAPLFAASPTRAPSWVALALILALSSSIALAPSAHARLSDAQTFAALQKYANKRNLTPVTKLGQGSFGSVWQVSGALATEAPAEAPAALTPAAPATYNRAIKIMNLYETPKSEKESTGPSPLRPNRRNLRELEALKKLSGTPGFVHMHHFDIIDDYIIVEMEFYPLTLQQYFGYLHSHRRMSAEEKAKAVKDVFDKLYERASFLWNEAGCIHRDLKPENILLDLDGNPYIADFGFLRLHGPGLQASRERPHTQPQKVGTAYYRSAGQILGKDQADDPASDLWALGCILGEGLKGGLLFPMQSNVPEEQVACIREESAKLGALTTDPELLAQLKKLLAPIKRERKLVLPQIVKPPLSSEDQSAAIEVKTSYKYTSTDPLQKIMSVGHPLNGRLHYFRVVNTLRKIQVKHNLSPFSFHAAVHLLRESLNRFQIASEGIVVLENIKYLGISALALASSYFDTPNIGLDQLFEFFKGQLLQEKIKEYIALLLKIQLPPVFPNQDMASILIANYYAELGMPSEYLDLAQYFLDLQAHFISEHTLSEKDLAAACIELSETLISKRPSELLSIEARTLLEHLAPYFTQDQVLGLLTFQERQAFRLNTFFNEHRDKFELVKNYFARYRPTPTRPRRPKKVPEDKRAHAETAAVALAEAAASETKAEGEIKTHEKSRPSHPRRKQKVPSTREIAAPEPSLSAQPLPPAKEERRRQKRVPRRAQRAPQQVSPQKN